MILEGFEIENWSCIKRVRINDLPPSGVVVLHAPNRHGKSSIVQALRACLMDYPSSSKSSDVTSQFPRGRSEKPLVSVTFRCGGAIYRIQKHFGGNKSDLASRTSAGEWKVETTSAAEAHERTCALVGGNDSSKGLHQLLWLTQAEFRLPEPKKFDAGVQTQLRGILGVLQTPLDDRFIERVKKRWNTWHSGQRKPGKQPHLKDGCALAEKLKELAELQGDLQRSEAKFNEIEGLLRQAENLRQAISDMNRQLQTQSDDLTQRQDEHQRCQERISARKQAEKDNEAAEKEQGAAMAEQQQRKDAARRCRTEFAAIKPARGNVRTVANEIKKLESRQELQRQTLASERDKRRSLQQRANRVAVKLAALVEAESLATARDVLIRAQTIANEIQEIETYLAENPAPDRNQLADLKSNRQKAVQLQADLDAAAMQLAITREENALSAQLILDGGAAKDVSNASPDIHSLRRKAELVIHGWGRVVFSRGEGGSNIEEREDQLRRLNDEFNNAAATFGIVGTDSDALEQLMRRLADHEAKQPTLASRKKEFKKLAPSGLERLRADVRALETKASATTDAQEHETESLPVSRSELEQLAATLQQELSDADDAVNGFEESWENLHEDLKGARQKETTAKELLAACEAKHKASREELGRLRSKQEVKERVKQANEALKSAKLRLQETELTAEESTIGERLNAAEVAVKALETQISENTRRLDVIKGRLLESEGLHAQRSLLAARVDQLTQITRQESLEKVAVDRLYELFEECKEKQLGALMGPIHNRVLGWMRVLDIGDYKEMRFNDAFLPDKLVTRDETAEFDVGEESKGAQEQIGILVRLALGSILASNGEPAVAILDDPLTHCDAARLNKMRVILRRAAEGDPNLNPPAGRLQILIFTCHPEWFRDEQALVIDLENPDVMTRLPV